MGLWWRAWAVWRRWRRGRLRGMWYLVTSTFTLPGRRGTYGTGWQWACSGHTHVIVTHHLLYTSLSLNFVNTHLCHTPSFVKHSFVTHHLSHTIFHTHLSHTPSPTHTIFHTHTHLCHRPSLTHIIVIQTHTHTSLSHIIFHCHTTFSHIFVTHHLLSQASLSHTIFHTQSFTHIFVTHHLPHIPSTHHLQNTHHCHTPTSLSHTIFHTHLCHTALFVTRTDTPSFAHNFVARTFVMHHLPPHTHMFVPHHQAHTQSFAHNLVAPHLGQSSHTTI